MFSFITISILQLLVLLTIHAHPEYQQAIPNGDNVYVTSSTGQKINYPGVGHLNIGGGGDRNVFGLDFAANGFTWTPALCQKDSDGDGATNGFELGDPDCTWTPGSTPKRTTDITHPGFAGDAAPAAIDTCGDFLASRPGLTNITVMLKPYTVPTTTTTYVRQAFDLRTILNEDFDAVRFEAILGRADINHHMLMYSCKESEVQNYLANPTITGGMPCSNGLVYAWAIGGLPFCFPNGVAMKFKTTSPFVLIEIHINNAKGEAGIIFQPGYKITVLPSSAPQQPQPAFTPANWIWVGVDNNKISIPPGKSQYTIRSSVPMPGRNLQSVVSVSVIAIIGHAHYLGRKLWLEAEDSRSGALSNGIRQLFCNPSYSNANQEMVPKKSPYPILTNKDTLYSNCVYDSSDRTSITTGGESTTNEMCMIFLLYIDTVGLGTYTNLQTDPTKLTFSATGDVSQLTQCVSSTSAGSGSLTGTAYIGYLPQWVLSHVVLAGFSFGFFVPIGTLFPATLRSVKGKGCCGKPWWFVLHRGFVATSLFGMIAWIIALTYSTYHLSTTHGRLGTAIVGMAIIQGLLGIFRPHLPKDENGEKSRARKIFEWVHPSLGRVIVICSAVQVALGYDLVLLNYVFVGLPGRASVSALKWIHAVAFFVLWGLIVIISKVLKYFKKNEGTGTNNKTGDDIKDAVVVGMGE
jgi:dopamine beta-monooxygenase